MIVGNRDGDKYTAIRVSPLLLIFGGGLLLLIGLITLQAGIGIIFLFLGGFCIWRGCVFLFRAGKTFVR